MLINLNFNDIYDLTVKNFYFSSNKNGKNSYNGICIVKIAFAPN